MATGACWSAPVDPSALDGDAPITFDDATEASGLVEPLTGMMGHAAAMGDVNQDGFADVFVGSFADRTSDTYEVRGASGPAPDRLLLGGPDGFRVDGDFPGTMGRSSSATFADLDNDGWLDLVVVRNRSASKQKSAQIAAAPTTIYRNEGDGRFTDVGTVGPDESGRAVTTFDVDGDGLLDLFIGQDGRDGTVALLRNDGDFEFTDITKEAGLPAPLIAFGVTAADLNADGHTDLAVAGSNRVFLADRSQPGVRFRDATPASFSWETYGDEDIVTGIAVGDLDRDGRPDLVVGHHFGSALKGEQVPVRVFLNRGNDDNGTPRWDDVTESAGVPGFTTKSPHVEIADFDNDGRPDLVVTASAGNGSRPVVLRNTGESGPGRPPRFSAPEGLGDPQYWVTGTVADVDRDGRLDLFAVEWEATKPSLLLRGTSPVGHWVTVDLGGTELGGIGSAVEVYRAGSASDPTALLGAGWVTGSTGYGAGPLPVVHVGLAAVTEVDIVIRAADGASTTLTGVAADQLVRPGTCGEDG